MSRTTRLIPLLIVGLLAAAVVFGLFLWGRTPATGPVHTSPPPPRTPNVAVPMPVGNLPGWRQVFADDFNGRTLNPGNWRVYEGQPGGDPAGWFDPRHVSVSGGELVISGYRDPADGGKWATGGIATQPAFAQTYGKYLVRFRLESGIGIGHALLLAAADGSWPPELDFSEDNGTGRSSTLVTLHYTADDRKIWKKLSVDLTRWHTLGVEWTPDLLRFTIDGRVWSAISGHAVPSVPMDLAIQTQSWPCVGTWGVCPNSSTPPVVRMYVDWVVFYAYAPALRR